jgi:predicted metal-dependent phosphoesterase TrpH
VADVLKIDLHTHTADDPLDHIPHTTKELIARAALLHFDALAVTLHDRQLAIDALIPYARDRGVLLIPGIERTIEGKHVLLLNFSRAVEDVHSFDDLARLKQRERGLVIAPHPFFPTSSCLGVLMDRYAELFDAVEYNGMFTTVMNFNRAAERWATRHGKPIVGNGDVHRLRQLGTTYSLVDAAADPAAICDAVAQGKVRVEAHPHSTITAARLVSTLMLTEAWARRRPEERTAERPSDGRSTARPHLASR